MRVRSPQAAKLRELVLADDVTVESTESSVLEVSGLTSEEIGKTASEHGITLFELTPQQASLEEAFMELTSKDVEFRTGERAVEEAA